MSHPHFEIIGYELEISRQLMASIVWGSRYTPNEVRCRNGTEHLYTAAL